MSFLFLILGAAQNPLEPCGDLEKNKNTMIREDQTNIRSQNIYDDLLSRNDSPTLKQSSFEGITGFIFFEKIYSLIWKKLSPNIFWENIFFDLKKIYCRIYFEKIYYLIWRKFIVVYILRKYIIWFQANLLPNIFWENIFTRLDLKKINLLSYIFWENILFDLKKIYCWIWRK